MSDCAAGESAANAAKSRTTTRFFALPMIVVYKTSPLTYLIGRSLIKLDRIGMVNILLNEMVVPELIQNEANLDNVFKTASKLLSDDKIYEKMKHKLGVVKEKLGRDGASLRAARSILEIMNESEKI